MSSISCEEKFSACHLGISSDVHLEVYYGYLGPCHNCNHHFVHYLTDLALAAHGQRHFGDADQTVITVQIASG